MAEPAQAAEQLVEKAAKLAPPETVAGAMWQIIVKPETIAERAFSAGVAVLVGLILWLCIVAALNAALRRLAKAAEAGEEARRRALLRSATALGLIANIAKWVILIGVIIRVLSVLGVNLIPVIAGVGVVGLAIGFGAQSLVRDLIAGLFVLLEGQYAVGDFVQIGSLFGQIKVVGLRVTVLQDLDGRLHYIPNGSVGTVTVFDRPLNEHTVDVPIADAAKASEAIEICNKVASELQRQYPVQFEVLSPAEPIGGEPVVVRMIVAALLQREWLALEELPARLKSALEAAGIALAPGLSIRVYRTLTTEITLPEHARPGRG